MEAPPVEPPIEHDPMVRVRRGVAQMSDRDRKQRWIIAALVILLAANIAVNVAMVAIISQQSDVLDNRTPAIAFIEAQARRDECVRRYELDWERAMAQATLSFGAHLNGEPVVPFRDAVRLAVENLARIEALCPVIPAPSELLPS